MNCSEPVRASLTHDTGLALEECWQDGRAPPHKAHGESGGPRCQGDDKHQLESMRSEIAGEDPSALELLLTERIGETWLQLFESLYASGLGEHTLDQDNYYQKRLDRAHGNHLSAICTLAQICKMGPAVQINIAEKRINTVG